MSNAHLIYNRQGLIPNMQQVFFPLLLVFRYLNSIACTCTSNGYWGKLQLNKKYAYTNCCNSASLRNQLQDFLWKHTKLLFIHSLSSFLSGV